MATRRHLHPIVVLLACITVLLTIRGGVYSVAAQLGTGDVTVDIAVYTCPEGTDPAADREALTGTCLDPADPYSITIGDGATWADGDDTTGSAPQEVHFSEVPAGIIQMVQHVPDGMGEPVVYCAETSASDAGEFTPALMYELPSESFHLHAFVREVEAGATLTCEIFNFPAAVATPEAMEPGVAVTIQACPAGTDRASTLEALTGQCQESAPPVGILVQHVDGYFQLAGEVSPSDGSQEVWLDGVPAGDIVIAPQLPEGYGEPLVFCAEGDAALQPVPLNLYGGAPWTLTEGATLTCQVFVFPVAAVASPIASPVVDTAAIEIVKHGCPQGEPAGDGGLDAYLAVCATFPVAEFTALDFETYTESARTAGTADDNSVRFADVPIVKVDIFEVRPEGALTLAVFCGEAPIGETPAIWQQASVISDLSIAWEAQPGGQLTCHWFNDIAA